mmetsp:Transcript_13528/g.26646  ORF Transcript_13528/g.26646 Transcript_13528/m.26646 type:complete len:184 (+) Transcript_13528:45-596(+)
MAKSMQLVLCCAFLIMAEAGVWFGGSGFLSLRLPDSFDLDLRNVVQKGSDISQAAASIAKESVSHAPNISTDLVNRSATERRSQQKRQRPKQRDAEASLIDSLRHMGEKGEDAVACVTTCRYGDAVRHEWSECLDKCVENPLMRSTFRAMLPKESHGAHATDVVVPEILQQRLERKRQRSAEL